jgi:hypothetical protein
LAHATGAYIIFCDQDDIWLPNKVEKLIAFHKQFPLSSMAYCLSKEFNGEVPADTIIGHKHFKELFSSDCLGSRGPIHQIEALERRPLWCAPVMIAASYCICGSQGAFWHSLSASSLIRAQSPA